MANGVLALLAVGAVASGLVRFAQARRHGQIPFVVWGMLGTSVAILVISLELLIRKL